MKWPEMLQRTLEPEQMDDPCDASEYNAMDHSQVNRDFVESLRNCSPLGQDILDLGTGTALIPIELCQWEPEVRIMASDSAVSMLEIARLNLELNNRMRQVQLHRGDAKSLTFGDAFFDTVISNSLIHHLAEPIQAIQEMWRVVRNDGLVFVRDLCRPDSASQVEELVNVHASQENDYSRQLFRQSLHAALTLDEIRSLVKSVGIPADSVQMTSDRHWTLSVRKTDS